MIHPKINDIIEEQKNRYKVVIAIAKNARKIALDAENDGVVLNDKPISLSIKEFEAEKVKIAL